MKNQSQARKRGSKTAANSQVRTPHRRAGDSSTNPLIALFQTGDLSESGELIDLSAAEYDALKLGAEAAGSDGVIMFMTTVALDKIRGALKTSAGSTAPKQCTR